MDDRGAEYYAFDSSARRVRNSEEDAYTSAHNKKRKREEMARHDRPRHQQQAEKDDSRFPYDSLDDDSRGRDYIRLLILEPIPKKRAQEGARARHNLPLKGRFVKISLDSTRGPIPSYEALSYTWGSEPERCHIFIKVADNSSTRGYYRHAIRITKNLDECLRRLRTDHEGDEQMAGCRVLWIDALCINQHEPEDALHEKSSQVRKMAKIYEKAKRVCIWVGPNEGDSGKVIPFVHRILGLNDLDELLRDRDRMVKWAAFSAFLQRPYFSRRWVIQEIAVSGSKRVYCGDDWIEWDDLSDAINLFEKHNQMIARLERGARGRKRGQVDEKVKEIKAWSANTLVNMTSSLFRRNPDGTICDRLASLERLVSALSQFDCGVARDVIYAVLALGRDSWQNPAIQADYSNWAVTKVYEDFVEFVIRTSKSLDIICVPWAMEKWHDGREQRSHEMPSWIPSCARRAFHPAASGGYHRANADCLTISDSGEKIYSASGSNTAQTYRLQPTSGEYLEEFSKWDTSRRKHERSFSAAGNPSRGQAPYPAFKSSLLIKSRRLFVSGIRITEIEKIERCATHGKVPESWLKAAVRVRPEPERNLPRGRVIRQPRTISYVPDEFWRTMVADRNSQGRSPPGVYKRFCALAFESAEGNDNNKVVNLAKLINEFKSDDVVDFLQRMRAVTFNRSFFISREKFFGLVESEAKTGDLVCILFGCSVPVVLRRTGDSERVYKVIGPCYLHGVMNGEAMLKPTSRMEFELI